MIRLFGAITQLWLSWLMYLTDFTNLWLVHFGTLPELKEIIEARFRWLCQMDLISRIQLQRINISLSPSIQMPTGKLQDGRVVIFLLQVRKNFFRKKTQYDCLQEQICSDCCHTEGWQSVKAMVTAVGSVGGVAFQALKSLEGQLEFPQPNAPKGESSFSNYREVFFFKSTHHPLNTFLEKFSEKLTSIKTPYYN